MRRLPRRTALDQLAHVDMLRANRLSGWTKKLAARQAGTDECVDCGGAFRAPPADRHPVCPACRDEGGA